MRYVNPPDPNVWYLDEDTGQFFRTKENTLKMITELEPRKIL